MPPLADGQTITTAHLRELLGHSELEVARFVSLGRGTARVEIVEAGRDRVTVIVIDAA